MGTMGRLKPPTRSDPPPIGLGTRVAAGRLLMVAVLAVTLVGCAAGPQAPPDPSAPSPTGGNTDSTTPSTSGDQTAVTAPPGTPEATMSGETGPTAPSVTEPTEDMDSGGAGSPGPTRVYTDSEYGFTFAYPEGWKLTVQAGAEAGPGGPSLRDVGAFDPTGSKAGGVLLDGVAVSVFPLNVVVNAELLPAFEKEIEDIVTDLRGRLSSVEVIDPLRPTTVNGRPGFETTHTFSYEGRRLRSRVVFLADGRLEYQLTAQAAESSWAVSGPGLNLLVDSFTPAD